MTKHAILSGCALVALGSATAAAAQTAPADVAEIVVTANRKSESIQSAPVAISAVRGEELARTGATQLDDALSGLAGVSVNQGPAGLDPIIRGIGPSLPAGVGGDNGISTTFDGVYNEANISARAGYYDVARIEVVRGPQGTLYGRNAEGGALNVISNDPTFRREGALMFGTGNYSLVQGQAMINLPVSDTFAIRAAGSVIDRSGYLSNGQDDNKAVSARIKALYKPHDGFSLLFGGEFSSFAGAGPGTVPTFTTPPSADVAYVSTNVRGQVFKRHGYKLWVQADADVGLANLSIIPAYQWLSAPEIFANQGLNNLIAPGNGALVQKSLEARLSSKPGSPVEWIVGGYLWDKQDDQFNQTSSRVVAGAIVPVVAPADAINFNVTQKADTQALFGQVKVPLGNGLRLVGGLRYSWDGKSYFRSIRQTVPATAHFRHFDWKAGLEFDASPNSHFYATAATGYRPGGISPQLPNPSFNNEELTSFEVGTKNDLFGRVLRLNLSAYHYTYKGFQFSNLTFPGGIAELSIINLPSVKNYGAELEAVLRPTTSDTLSANVAYLHSRIKSAFILSPQNVQLQGSALPNSPEWTVSATYGHVFDFNSVTIRPTATLRYSSSYYVILPVSPASSQGAYTQYDAAISIEPKHTPLVFSLYARNIGRTVVKSNFIGNRLSLQSPRTYGLTVSARF